MRREAIENEPEQLLRMTMRRQAALSIRVAVVFVGLLAGLPLLNLYAPDLMRTNVGGFTLTWLILGVLFFIVTTLLSLYYVRQSDAIETAIVNEAGGPMEKSS